MADLVKTLTVGTEKTKGVLQRSGIVAALVTTAFVVLDGLAGGDGVLAALASNRATLEPLWATAITMALASSSGKGAA